MVALLLGLIWVGKEMASISLASLSRRHLAPCVPFPHAGTSATVVGDRVLCFSGPNATELSCGLSSWASFSPLVSGMWLVAEAGELGG